MQLLYSGCANISILSDFVHKVEEDGSYLLTYLLVSKFMSRRILKTTEVTTVTECDRDESIDVASGMEFLPVRNEYICKFVSVDLTTLEEKLCCSNCKTEVSAKESVVICSNCSRMSLVEHCTRSGVTKCTIINENTGKKEKVDISLQMLSSVTDVSISEKIQFVKDLLVNRYNITITIVKI